MSLSCLSHRWVFSDVLVLSRWWVMQYELKFRNSFSTNLTNNYCVNIQRFEAPINRDVVEIQLFKINYGSLMYCEQAFMMFSSIKSSSAIFRWPKMNFWITTVAYQLLLITMLILIWWCEIPGNFDKLLWLWWCPSLLAVIFCNYYRAGSFFWPLKTVIWFLFVKILKNFIQLIRFFLTDIVFDHYVLIIIIVAHHLTDKCNYG